MNLKKFLINVLIITFAFSSIAEEKVLKDQNTEFSVYTGMFDFSDDGKKSTLIGFQHQNENLNRDTFLGNLSPITGFLITADNAGYIYTGVQAQYKLGALNLTPSFTPGIYHEGDGKDLGHLIEFKSELQISLDLSKTSELGFSYNHISNASLGDKNNVILIFLPKTVVDKSGSPTLLRILGTKSQSLKASVFLFKVTSSSAPPSI